MSVGKSYEKNTIATDEIDPILKFESSSNFCTSYREFLVCMTRKGDGLALNKHRLDVIEHIIKCKMDIQILRVGRISTL